MKEITLTQGKIALVSDEDFDYLNQFRWHAWKHGNTFYARRNGTPRGYRIYMHRDILNLNDKKMIGEHKDGNGLNNQRDNLRIANQSQNCSNRVTKKGVSKYVGVSWHKQNKKWQVNIKTNYKQKHVGTFLSEDEAALAYNNAAIDLHGEFASINVIN